MNNSLWTKWANKWLLFRWGGRWGQFYRWEEMKGNLVCSWFSAHVSHTGSKGFLLLSPRPLICLFPSIQAISGYLFFWIFILVTHGYTKVHIDSVLHMCWCFCTTGYSSSTQRKREEKKRCIVWECVFIGQIMSGKTDWLTEQLPTYFSWVNLDQF